MLIAVDFDDTIDRDPDLFGSIISRFQDWGHDVCIVTQNFEDQRDDIREYAWDHNCPVFYTGSALKRPYLKKLGLVVDIWIDDNPERI